MHTRSRSRSRRSSPRSGRWSSASLVGLPAPAHPRPARRGRHAWRSASRSRRCGSATPTTSARAARTSSGPTLFGLDLRSRVGADFPRLQFGLLVLVVLVGVGVGVAKLRTSRLGSEMLAVRANERSAAGAGINVVRVKLVAFAIAAFIAGLGGSMLGYFQGNVTFDAVHDARRPGAVRHRLRRRHHQRVRRHRRRDARRPAASWPRRLGDKPLHLGRLVRGASAAVGLVFTVIKNPEGIVGPIHDLARPRRRLARSRGRGTGRCRSEARRGTRRRCEPVEGGDVVLATDGVTRPLRRRGRGRRTSTSRCRRGTIVGLIGPNGAGQDDADRRHQRVHPVHGRGRPRRPRRSPACRRTNGCGPGSGRTFQQTQLYDDLSVTENVVVGAAAAPRSARPRTCDEIARAARPGRRRRPAGRRAAPRAGASSCRSPGP